MVKLNPTRPAMNNGPDMFLTPKQTLLVAISLPEQFPFTAGIECLHCGNQSNDTAVDFIPCRVLIGFISFSSWFQPIHH